MKPTANRSAPGVPKLPPRAKLLLAAGAILAASLMQSPLARAGQDSLVLGGTGGDLATLRMLGKAFASKHPGVTVKVLPSLGSGGGIKAVLAGAINLSISARQVKEKERAKGAKAFPYGVTAVVLAVPSSAARDKISSAEAIDYVAGKKKRWPDGTPVQLVMRPSNDSDYVTLAKGIPGMDKALAVASKREILPVTGSDQETASAIEGLPGGLGYISLTVIKAEKRALKPLALDNVMPSAETIKDGSYGLTKTFYLVTGPTVSARASEFILFMNSPDGIKILRDTGHSEVAVKAEKN